MRRMTLVLGCLILTACDGRKDGDAGTADSRKTASPTAVAPAPKSGSDFPKADRSKPLSDYLDFNSDPMMLTYVVTSRSGGSLSDEDKLNRFSSAYYNEQDAFKKREIAQRELPGIAAALEKYRAHNYYSVPVGASDLKLGAPTPLQIANVVVGEYDFSAKSFVLSSYVGVYCWSTPVRNEQGAMLRILPSDFPCSVPVTDEAEAKTVEAARAQNALELKGRLYLFVPRSENGTAQAVVAHARLELVQSRTKAVLAQLEW